MGRRILMTGKDAKYIHIHEKDAPQSERDILLTGDNAEFVEVTVGDKIYENVTDKQDKSKLYVRRQDNKEASKKGL